VDTPDDPTDIDPIETPETNGQGGIGGIGTSDDTGYWSLLSLIMSLIAVIFSLLLIVGAFIRRRNRENGEKYSGGIVKILAIVLGIATPIVWLLLDNLNHSMHFVNRDTIYVAIVFIVQLAVIGIYYLRKNKRNDDNDLTPIEAD
jgi:Na+/proline symporter